MTTEAEIEPAYLAARARIEERRNRWTTYSEAEHLRAKLDGRTLRESSIHDPEFRPAATAAEAWDDLVVLFGKLTNRGFPEHLFLAGLAVAARDGGAAAAVKTVKEARQLTPAQQHAANQNLQTLEKDPGGRFADLQQIFRSVLAEWSRLELCDRNPEQYQQGRRAAS